MQSNLFDCLHDYLQQIVENLTQKEDFTADRPKLICLTAWLLELKLNEIYDHNQISEAAEDPNFKHQYEQLTQS
jgi:hypothetical protein